MIDIVCNICNEANVYVMATSEVVEALTGSFEDDVFLATGSTMEDQEYFNYVTYCPDCYDRVTVVVEW